MNREGQRVEIYTYHSEGETIQGIVIKSSPPEVTGFDFWIHYIQADEYFLANHLGENSKLCHRSESEIIKEL